MVAAGYGARIPAESVATVSYPEDQGFRLAPRYGLGAWCGHGDGTFSMAGRHGQLCIVSPLGEAVVTITAHAEGRALRAPRSRPWSARSDSNACRTNTTSGFSRVMPAPLVRSRLPADKRS